ncbi:MAG TPA: hypothetical protein VM936_14145 [Pyrinomonadaceae bacterium]|jgi:hypothetical protein|nr:hypothetical protein [Pyrinomonadaceae bacterium]
MREWERWLLHEDQKELFEFLFAAALSLSFGVLAALALWPLGDAALALRFAKGGVVLWAVLFVTYVALAFAQRKLDVDLYSHADAYVISGAAVGALIQTGWSAFAALSVRDFASGAGAWASVALYFAGLLSCYVAYVVVSAFYTGQIYKLINLAVALAGFAAFCLWPAGARAAYGWFFRLFQSF